MAKVETTVILRGISGKMGDIVFVNRDGEVHIRKRVVQHDPKTPKQRAMRDNMKQVVSEWQAMGPEEKDLWKHLSKAKSKVKKKKISGYHYFVGHRMKELRKN
ncbi:MAG TPA: hypothetical protein PK200_15410 [Spirochaetota bacterium]|nr:hypothetical protein [Spirochaetota bacterium]